MATEKNSLEKGYKNGQGCGYKIASLILGIFIIIYATKSGYDIFGIIGECFSKINDTYCEFFRVIFS